MKAHVLVLSAAIAAAQQLNLLTWPSTAFVREPVS